MKKKLNVESVKNELKGSVFFQGNDEHSLTTSPPEAKIEKGKKLPPQSKESTMKPRNHEINQNSELARNQASTLAGNQDQMVFNIRKAVKEVGKETLFVRLTSEEKEKLKDLVYLLSKQRAKISDNEVGRIALNYLLEDYRARGKSSMLIRVIEALNA